MPGFKTLTSKSPAQLEDSHLVSPDSCDPVIEAYKKDVDRTLLRENLKLTVAERCRKFERDMRLIYELQRAGRRKREQRDATP